MQGRNVFRMARSKTDCEPPSAGTPDCSGAMISSLRFGLRNGTLRGLYMEKEAAPLPFFDRLWTWFETNKKQALYGAVVLVGGGLIAGYVYWQQTEKEIAAGETLSSVSA